MNVKKQFVSFTAACTQAEVERIIDRSRVRLLFQLPTGMAHRGRALWSSR